MTTKIMIKRYNEQLKRAQRAEQRIAKLVTQLSTQEAIRVAARANMAKINRALERK